MRKKFLPYILTVILILAVTLSGCGGSGGGNNGGTTPAPTDSDFINGLLDQYQSGMKNKNAELVASLCVFPFTDIFSGGTTHDTAAAMIYWYQMMFTYTIKSVDICEITPRIIVVNGNNATVDGYYHLISTPISGDPAEYTNPVEITAVKDNGTWKLSAIVASDNIEKYMINSLLDQYQAAMKNKDADALVSSCTFPFNDESTFYNDAAAMKTAYQTEFSQIESISIYEIIDRDIVISSSESGYSALVDASIRLKEKFQSGTTLDYTYTCEIYAKKVGGAWKVSGIVRKS